MAALAPVQSETVPRPTFDQTPLELDGHLCETQDLLQLVINDLGRIHPDDEEETEAGVTRACVVLEMVQSRLGWLGNELQERWPDRGTPQADLAVTPSP